MEHLKQFWRDLALDRTEGHFDFHNLTKEKAAYCDLIDAEDKEDGMEICGNIQVKRSVIAACEDPVQFVLGFDEFQDSLNEEVDNEKVTIECLRCCTEINDQNMAITNSLMGDPFTDNDYHCINCYREITKDWASKPTL